MEARFFRSAKIFMQDHECLGACCCEHIDSDGLGSFTQDNKTTRTIDLVFQIHLWLACFTANWYWFSCPTWVAAHAFVGAKSNQLHPALTQVLFSKTSKNISASGFQTAVNYHLLLPLCYTSLWTNENQERRIHSQAHAIDIDSQRTPCYSPCFQHMDAFYFKLLLWANR